MGRKFPTVALSFLAVIFAGLIYIVCTVRIGDSDWSWDELATGKITAGIDSAVVKKMSAVGNSLSWAAGIEYRYLGDAGPFVTPGCAGWLFLTEEMREFPGGDKNLAERLHILNILFKKFAGKSAKLILLPIPDKNDLARTKLCGATVAEQARQRSRLWMSNLKHERADYIDLREGWPQPGFWRTDSHWDQAGARFAARKTAAVIVDIVGNGTDNVRLEETKGPLSRVGDLMRLAGLASVYRWSGPSPDLEFTTTSEIKRKGGLLDEIKQPRIILAGSSFSLNSNFLDYLQDATSDEVLQYSRPGAGFAGALMTLLKLQPHSVEQTKIVIWEFPLRSLTEPMTADEIEFLKDNS